METPEEFYDNRYRGTDYMARWGGASQAKVRDVLQGVPFEPKEILDFGCGRGAWIGLLADVFPKARITGTDISEVSVQQARQSFPQHEFVVSRSGADPLQGRKFDLIFSFHVVSHLQDVDSVVRQLSEWCAPGGMICVVTSVDDPSFSRKMVHKVGLVEKSANGGLRYAYDDPGILQRMSTEEMQTVFAKHGLRLFKKHSANQLWGEIQFLKGNPSVIRRVLDPRKPSGWIDRFQVLGWRIFLQGLSWIHIADKKLTRQGFRDERNPLKKAVMLGGFALKKLQLIQWPLGLVDYLAKHEWSEKREKVSGSLAYLIFQRDQAFTHYIFDLDETLILRHVTLRKILPELHMRLCASGLPIRDFREFEKFYFDLDQNGRGKDPLFDEVVRLCCGQLTLETLNRWYYELYIGAIELAPEARACLEGIAKAGGKLGLITNGPPTQWDKIRKVGAKEFFGDRMIVSSDTGTAKPDPRIFRMMEEKMGPGRYLYVGDSMDHDIEGATQAGWSAAWINRTGASAALPSGAFRIQSLTELLSSTPSPNVSPKV